MDKGMKEESSVDIKTNIHWKKEVIISLESCEENLLKNDSSQLNKNLKESQNGFWALTEEQEQKLGGLDLDNES